MDLVAGQPAEFAAHFQDADGVSKDGITVTYSLRGPGHTVIDSGTATPMGGDGLYYHRHTTTITGSYYCTFKTADTTVASRDLATSVIAGPGFI